MELEHQDTSYGGGAVFKCDYCNYSSYDKGCRDDHIKRKHLGKDEIILLQLIPQCIIKSAFGPR